MDHYDLLVIGSGPAGQKAAIAAAKLGRRSAVVERKDMVGGVCINTGTIPSKTLREAVLYLTGLNQRELYGHSYRVKDDITVADLSARTQHVIGREIDVIRNQLSRNRVALYSGTARFVDPHTLEIQTDHDVHQSVTADYVVIAVGTRPGPADHGRFRRGDHRRLRPDPGHGQGAGVDGGGRGRRHRHRVRLDVRRARHQGHRGGEASTDAGVLRPGGGRGAQVPAARPGRHVPVRRIGARKCRSTTAGR